jgi:hypothetical protein
MMVASNLFVSKEPRMNRRRDEKIWCLLLGSVTLTKPRLLVALTFSDNY